MIASRFRFAVVWIAFYCLPGTAFTQPVKIVAECTIAYSVNIDGMPGNANTNKTLYIKGRKVRSEIQSPFFYQATIFDNKSGDAVILKEVGNDKYISLFNAGEWREKNKEWKDVSVNITGENKKLLNYNCRKAIIRTSEGIEYIVYFTTELNASATENPFQFKNITGLVLEYELQSEEGKNIQFVATNIDFSPVPAAKFAIPEAGYRIIK